MSRIIRPVITEETKAIEIRSLLMKNFFAPAEKSNEEAAEEREQFLVDSERRIAAGKLRLLEAERNFKEKMEQQQAAWQEEKKTLQQAAYEDGFQQGFEDGVNKGYAETSAALEQANEVTVHAAQLADQYLAKQEQVVLELALAAASRIVLEVIEDDHGKFLSIVKKAVKEAREMDKVKLFVSAEDYRLVAASKEDLVALLPAEVPFMIFAEDTLEKSEGYVETSHGRIVFSIEEQLKELRIKLSELMESEGI